MQITPESHALFIEFAEDAGNWSSMVPTDGNIDMTKEQRGNLTQLKKAGLIATQYERGTAWVMFTAEGVAYAKEHGVSGAEYIEALA